MSIAVGSYNNDDLVSSDILLKCTQELTGFKLPIVELEVLRIEVKESCIQHKFGEFVVYPCVRPLIY